MSPDEPSLGRRKLKRIAFLAGAVVLVGAVGTALVIRFDREHPSNFGTVVKDKIYRSARVIPTDFDELARDYKIRSVIDLGGSAIDSETDRNNDLAAAAAGIVRYRLNLNGDGTGNPNNYVQALRLMSNPDNQPVLIHCAAGAERTGACVILYRHLFENEKIVDAYREAMTHETDPTDNWVMLAYVAEWNDEIERAVRDGNSIAGKPEVAPRVGGARQTNAAASVLRDIPGKLH